MILEPGPPVVTIPKLWPMQIYVIYRVDRKKVPHFCFCYKIRYSQWNCTKFSEFITLTSLHSIAKIQTNWYTRTQVMSALLNIVRNRNEQWPVALSRNSFGESCPDYWYGVHPEIWKLRYVCKLFCKINTWDKFKWHWNMTLTWHDIAITPWHMTL